MTGESSQQTRSLEKVNKYWDAVAKRLTLESRGMAGLVEHRGERGRANEKSFSEMFDSLLPPSVRVGTGEVIDAFGGVSPQMDTLVLSKTMQPVLFSQTEEMLFPVESVLMCVEVKTTLTSSEVADIGEKVRKYKELRSSNEQLPAFGVFAHQAGARPQSVASWFKGLPAAKRPDFLLVNDSAIFGAVDPNSAEGYRVEMVIRADAEGRWQRSYDEVPGVGTDSVERALWKPMAKSRGDHVQVHHGGALLLFLEATLHELSVRGHADIEWLRGYLKKFQSKRVRYGDGEPTLIG
jgi:hypothetical protein